MFHQLRRDRETAISFTRLYRLDPTAPHTLANVNDGVFQIQISNPQGANLATADSDLGQNRVERLVGLTGGGNDKLRVFQRKGKSVDESPLGQNQPIEGVVSYVAPRPGAIPHHAKRRHEIADRLRIAVAVRHEGLQLLAIQVLE